jgi:hypothetical protein
MLGIDLETSPNLAHVWGLWNQNVGLPQLLESTEMLCFAAKWFGEKKIAFHSGFHDSKPAMVRAAHELLDEADVVVHFNGRRFDVPHLNREFILAGLTPPSPYKQIDLLQVVKSTFRFPSNKLAYVSKVLGLDGKVQHSGHELWIKCMAGDPKAWNVMRRYNKQDVQLLEELYRLLLPWIKGHPNAALIDGEGLCPKCKSTDVQKRGYAATGVSTYQQYRCNGCGSWFRGGKRLEGADLREVAG